MCQLLWEVIQVCSCCSLERGTFMFGVTISGMVVIKEC